MMRPRPHPQVLRRLGSRGWVAVSWAQPDDTGQETQAKFARYRVFPLRALPAYVGSYYRDLEVADLKWEGERYASYTITGRVKNVGPGMRRSSRGDL